MWIDEFRSLRCGLVAALRILDRFALGANQENPVLTRPFGLEQGFVIGERPPGQGPVIIQGRIHSDLQARVRGEGDRLSFMSGGREVLRYDKLVIEDAKGARLPGGLLLEGEKLSIVIEREGAYPIFVDPLCTSPDWEAQSDQTSSDFGWSVAGAGDVNNDGYSDVIVGAPMYSRDYGMQGRAYVYHGSALGLSLTPCWVADGS